MVVVRVAHFYQPGQQERLELQLTGCQLIAHHTRPRAGELNGLQWLRHAQAASEGSLFREMLLRLFCPRSPLPPLLLPSCRS